MEANEYSFRMPDRDVSARKLREFAERRFGENALSEWLRYWISAQIGQELWSALPVTPAQAGIHGRIGPGLRRDDQMRAQSESITVIDENNCSSAVDVGRHRLGR
jgi:hypothetical protein